MSCRTRILRVKWICGHTRKDTFRNEDIRDKVVVVSMVDKMREARLRWFEHVKRRCPNIPVRRCERLDMGGLKKGRGRLKKHWGVSGHDLTLL
ncbi:hypothetical protein H5410_034703 [Solanum commersonii]|uniref:Uncharacterized protein n=1 Tax=Solanum commersonii TaxID=4109 RepID=A0A9J5YU38_SOLCO|nr:hypothetical protein H5410_034703 [Solanum commersonii]